MVVWRGDASLESRCKLNCTPCCSPWSCAEGLPTLQYSFSRIAMSSPCDHIVAVAYHTAPYGLLGVNTVPPLLY
ncbi:hypothetical protein cypCar_00012305 [Cyprinus carpio]|nr:hypothetical protein cypCar_00012305 [Cyprinus carpio]